MPAVIATEIDAQRSTMRSKLLDIKYPQAVPTREPIDREKRKVRKMFMINRIELVLDHETFEMREFQRNDALRRQQHGHSGGKVVEIRNLRQDVISDDQIGALPLGHQTAGQG